MNNEPVFFGKPLRLRRQKVIVHSPLKSLQDITLIRLSEHLRDVDAVDELEIPQILKPNLRKAVQICEEHKKRLLVKPES